MNVTHSIGIGFLLLLFAAGTLCADGVSPAYLEMTEQPNGRLEVTWKVPVVKGERVPIEPILPDAYKPAGPMNQIKMDNAVMSKWPLLGENIDLAGQQIAIEGLSSTVVEVLVRIKLKDGRIHRLVLRPNEPSTTVPLPEKTTGSQIVNSTLLQISQQRFLIVCILGLTITCLAKVRRQQFVVCLSVLLAGALFGHTIGAFAGSDRLFTNGMPSTDQNIRILHGLLLNTYRSCQYQDEELAYDRLSRSVTGDLLTSVYLQNRDMLNIGQTEGAKSMIERVDVRNVEPLDVLEDGAYSVSANWDVYGSVSHWEHTHYRCNSYRAIVTIIPTDDYWKISSIEITDEQRVL
jgi:hypothetical protein